MTTYAKISVTSIKQCNLTPPSNILYLLLIRYSCSCRISLNNLKAIIPGRKYIVRSELECLLQDSLVVDLNNTYPTELLRSLNKYFDVSP